MRSNIPIFLKILILMPTFILQTHNQQLVANRTAEESLSDSGDMILRMWPCRHVDLDSTTLKGEQGRRRRRRGGAEGEYMDGKYACVNAKVMARAGLTTRESRANYSYFRLPSHGKLTKEMVMAAQLAFAKRMEEREKAQQAASIDKAVDALADRFLDNLALKTWPLFHADVERTALAKLTRISSAFGSHGFTGRLPFHFLSPTGIRRFLFKSYEQIHSPEGRN